VKTRNIVVGYNATETCERAVRLAAALAERVSATLHVVGVSAAVVPLGGFGWVAPYETTAYLDQAQRERVHEGARLCPEGVTVEEHAEFGMPGVGIVRRHPRHIHMRNHGYKKAETAAKRAKVGIWKK